MYFLYDSSVGEGVCVGVGGCVWVIGWAMGWCLGGGELHTEKLIKEILCKFY